MGIELHGKVALVTGAASGIGAEIARRFAAYGAQVVVTDVRVDAGEVTAKGICDAGGLAIFIHQDVAVEDQWSGVVHGAIKAFGGLDILVNNAGIEQTCPLADVDLADVERIMAVNVIGTILGHKHAIRAMRPGGAAGKGGSIINMSSIAGLIGAPAMAVYGATKGAVRLLSKAAAVECGRFGYGIRVNSIHPGLVATEMGGKLVDDFVRLGFFSDRSAANERIPADYPIGRIGVPSDIADAALFLASELSSWITGAEFVVDGGVTAS